MLLPLSQGGLRLDTEWYPFNFQEFRLNKAFLAPVVEKTATSPRLLGGDGDYSDLTNHVANRVDWRLRITKLTVY